MARKVNKDYVNQYSKIVFTQPLAHGKYIQQTYDKTDKGWVVSHSTNSAYHICPYDGIFRNCKDCGALEDDFDVKFCLKKQQIISAGALSNRANDCLSAGLDVQFIDQEIDMEEVRCPVDDCENCEFNRTQSWCARALPEYKGHTELEKIRMEGFWEAVDWCEEHYKWMEEHWDKLDGYSGLVIKILEECYADGRAPSAEEMTKVDNFWNED